MVPEGVPDDLYRAAVAALRGMAVAETPLVIEKVLAAVLPMHEQEVVERVAGMYEQRLLLAQAELRALRRENTGLRQDGRLADARVLAETAKPGLTAPPEDCSNACMDAACDCSGKWRATAWTLDPEELIAILDRRP
ncbi:hypothetical protein [Actinocorallia longicatena]|uniref:DUF222 domain-containing protein n=1 Tax=Actinocorallia longicatena TaxID=111803 RepID=A0ABP6QHA3_9ACTN